MSDTELPLPFSLTYAESHSVLWLKLRAQFEAMLKDLRGQNDGPLDQDKTATIRGQIKLLKAIMRLGDETPNIDV